MTPKQEYILTLRDTDKVHLEMMLQRYIMDCNARIATIRRKHSTDIADIMVADIEACIDRATTMIERIVHA